MKRLELKEMEKIEAGGWGCALSVIGLVTGFAGMFVLGPITGGASWIALASTLGGFIVSGASAGYSC